ncbi:transcription elongation factor GreA [Candidatus Roizmanbacteria bacterium RIFCSPLOWO2_01_FULL_42_14]|uniref:Transcription elongation factor GreA n=4 Tax=Candidatus Roizmaniibacteriota TaxID=1752723 RepID=A0A1F7JSH7_9BACT|nr:MAG: transcription elongation factor GreA [Candidatus Roizmanbacteria bacterium RIFCSPHIGHO2_02_FULL_43_11]OGK38931.1 MAG: transcription elongation factor GreA [Candidatus Roizmanbacteria bacterium RIFCSPHIGHO2_12_FULL_42_10]OGK52009.1 MAG: transcription elongation factor GreA [Candidatus Roizmanbacteria bacterium RIFCSPLOWO2_01_FULL_42_14]OGK58567.1 MAG: transcription elongation factor GreA [Candidatus Roizmanbacteria bacterium RIFCSPLOWO2_02_FULL_43_10]
MPDTYKLSQEGYDKLVRELDELKKGKRPKAVERLAAARAMGDLSENSEYTAARENLTLVDTRIAEIEAVMHNVEIVQVQANNGAVQLGDTVRVKVEDGHEEYSIVGELEADIAKNQISDTSPIGKALLGSKIGDTVTVATPAGEVVYKIVEIK